MNRVPRDAVPLKPKKRKAASRRLGAEGSRTYARLLDAAASILKKEGSGGVTALKLASAVGLKREIVHYYFGTIEDVFIALMRREGERVRAAITKAMESEQPLRTIWTMSRSEDTSFLEFVVLAQRSRAIRAEVKRFTEEFRAIQTEALTRHLENRGIKIGVPPVALVFMLHGLIQSLAIETGLDIADGHPEAEATIEQYITEFERQNKASSRHKS